MDNIWYLNKKKKSIQCFFNNEYNFNKNNKIYKILINK
jgi:hypothetical protein